MIVKELRHALAVLALTLFIGANAQAQCANDPYPWCFAFGIPPACIPNHCYSYGYNYDWWSQWDSCWCRDSWCFWYTWQWVPLDQQYECLVCYVDAFEFCYEYL